MSTTPASPRSTWSARKFRLDDETYHAVTRRLAADREKLQAVLEVMLADWLAGNYDVAARREELKAQGKLSD